MATCSPSLTHPSHFPHTSLTFPLHPQLPYEFYSLPYCRPEKIQHSAENLGEVLRGDRIENSLYQIAMRVDEQCKVLCRIGALAGGQADAFRSRIDDDYRVYM